MASIADEVEQGEKSVDQNANLARFDEDLARTLQVLGQIYAFVAGLFEFMIYESTVLYLLLVIR